MTRGAGGSTRRSMSRWERTLPFLKMLSVFGFARGQLALSLSVTLVRPCLQAPQPGPRGLRIPGGSQVSKIGWPPLKPNTVPFGSSLLTPLPHPTACRAQSSLHISCTAAVTLHCHNRNLFPAVGLIGTCILQAGGAGHWLQVTLL